MIGSTGILNGLHETASVIDESRCYVPPNDSQFLLDAATGGRRMCGIHNTSGDREDARGRVRLIAERALIFDVCNTFLDPPSVVVSHTMWIDEQNMHERTHGRRNSCMGKISVLFRSSQHSVSQFVS